ncbi:MAG: hypothetical protein P1V36_07500 [Planctomycetota bacterium]|nr:hypothetical protein [Planctomycetota bacterium]
MSFAPHPPEIPRKAPDEAPGWFDRPKNVRLLKILAVLSVVVMFGLDFTIHYHQYLGGENIPGFYTLFGLLASVVLIFVAKLGGKPLKRKDDYYDE